MHRLLSDTPNGTRSLYPSRTLTLDCGTKTCGENRHGGYMQSAGTGFVPFQPLRADAYPLSHSLRRPSLLPRKGGRSPTL